MIRPGSSGSNEERPVPNGEAAGSTPARGSSPTVQRSAGVQNPGETNGNPRASYQYIVVRKELSGGALLAQVAHAAGESADKCAGLDSMTRVVVLGATKDELVQLAAQLEKQTITSAFARILETDGPLAGSVTAVGVVTSMREELKLQVPILDALKPWRGKV